MAKGRVTIDFDNKSGMTKIDVKVIDGTFSPAQMLYYVIQSSILEAANLSSQDRIIDRITAEEILSIADSTVKSSALDLVKILNKVQIDNDMKSIIFKYMEGFSKN